MAQEMPLPTRRDVMAGAAVLALTAVRRWPRERQRQREGQCLMLTAVPALASPALWCRTGWRW